MLHGWRLICCLSCAAPWAHVHVIIVIVIVIMTTVRVGSCPFFIHTFRPQDGGRYCVGQRKRYRSCHVTVSSHPSLVCSCYTNHHLCTLSLISLFCTATKLSTSAMYTCYNLSLIVVWLLMIVSWRPAIFNGLVDDVVRLLLDCVMTLCHY